MYVPADGVVAVAAVATEAGHHVLRLVRPQDIRLVGRRVGVNGGGVMAAIIVLVAIGFGVPTMSAGIFVGVRVGISGVPIRLLVNLITSVDGIVGTISLVGGVEVDVRVVGDIAGVDTGSAVSGIVTAGRDGVEMDRVGRDVN